MAESTRAIVTLLIGAKFQERWRRLCRANWQTYADRHGYDLVVLEQPLDDSARASGRSPSWQKCLALGSSAVRRYRQVVWIDADVLFNLIGAPDICETVPETRVGAVDSFADPSPEENRLALDRLWKMHGRNQDATQRYTKPEDVYRNYGPTVEPLSRMLNAGILVMSPVCHADLFRRVYDTYEDRGNPSYYENVPLSYELLKHDLVQWLDPRFNHLWAWSKYLHYLFLHDSDARSPRDKVLRRLAVWTGNDYERRVAVACATSALLNCYCLHFAGCAEEMDLVDLTTAAQGRVRNLGMR